jgi:hypothetical protein
MTAYDRRQRRRPGFRLIVVVGIAATVFTVVVKTKAADYVVPSAARRSAHNTLGAVLPLIW